MADYSRSQLYSENRNRIRAHVPCPRCRIDPSHISRQHWETRRPSPSLELNNSGNVNMATNSTVELRVNGYPDLCPRGSVGNYRPQTSIPPLPNVHQSNRGSATNYYNQSHGLVRSSDTHSARSGDTWRIRGVLENHPPDVTRRADSNTGPLPDVTRHSTPTVTSIQHSRVPSTSGYDPHHQQNVPRSAPAGTRYLDPHHQPSSSCREPQNVTVRSDLNSNRSTTPQWKRDHQCSVASGSPWVTRSLQDRPQQYNGGNSVNNSNAGNTQWSNQQPSSSSCWRPAPLSAPQHVLSQCPLPDLVTPRRQARKQCCGLLATHSVAVRWLVVVVASLGLLCSVVGTVVGVVRAAGKEHLSVALLLIGLGIVLVSMSGVAWRLTSRDSPSCGAMFGFRRARHEPHRRFVPRVPHYGRPHPFSAMLYPDIPLRPPPPSYQASMQEYRLRLLLMDRPQAPPTAAPPPPPPPPTYRGPATVYPRFPVNIGVSDYSRPPSYRSRPRSAGQPSPVGGDEAEINASTANNDQLAGDVGLLTIISSSTRPAPPNGSNHVEVVAQV